MFRMTDRRIRKRSTDKQTNAGEMIENKIGRYILILLSKEVQHVKAECL